MSSRKSKVLVRMAFGRLNNLLIYKTEYFGHPIELEFKVMGGDIKIVGIIGSKKIVDSMDKISDRQYDEWMEEIENELCEEDERESGSNQSDDIDLEVIS
jgi:hypothetical protein